MDEDEGGLGERWGDEGTRVFFWTLVESKFKFKLSLIKIRRTKQDHAGGDLSLGEQVGLA